MCMFALWIRHDLLKTWDIDFEIEFNLIKSSVDSLLWCDGLN